MTKLMLEAIEALRRLPEEQQDRIAGAVLQLAGTQAAPAYVLTAEEEADLDEADREVERGEFATDEEVRAIWAKYEL